MTGKVTHMKSSELLVEEGIRAAKARQMNEARQILEQAIELDERNVQAWLWLSGVVDTNEDRRICLENVLAIEPDNAAAMKGLTRLNERLTVPLTGNTGSWSKGEVQAAHNNAGNGTTTTLESQTTAATLPQSQAKQGDRLTTILLALGVVFFVIAIFVAGLVLLRPMISGVGTGDKTVEVAPAEVGPAVDPGRAVLATMHENVAAMNAGDVPRYMATIHSSSPSYRETERMMEQLVADYVLQATWDKAEVIEVGRQEARVDFVLTTRKISGPAFRDNRIKGEMLLRQEDGRWKIYNQQVDDITYID